MVKNNRTGTTQWKKIRNELLKEAIENNIFNCPLCHVGLDYEYSRRPNSPEIDHIVPVARGGTDDKSNLRIICRLCNTSIGAGGKTKRPEPKRIETATRIEW